MNPAAPVTNAFMKELLLRIVCTAIAERATSACRIVSKILRLAGRRRGRPAGSSEAWTVCPVASSCASAARTTR